MPAGRYRVLGGSRTRRSINLNRDTLQLQTVVHKLTRDWQAGLSLTVHKGDSQTGGTIPLRSDIHVGALPPGDYELHVALYDWRTGERLVARDPATGLVSDMHVLHRFHVD